MKTAAQILGDSGAGVYSPRLPGSAIGYLQSAIPAQGNAAPCPSFVDVEPPILLREDSYNRLPRRLAILLASRGQVFSRAMESILREAAAVEGFTDIALFMSHGLAIPAAQSHIITRAMQWGADVTWLVEEDNYMPSGVLAELLAKRAEGNLVASCAYFNHEGSAWVFPPWHERLQFHAFGCTLVDAVVWRLIGAPYCFRGRHILFDALGEPYEHPTSFFEYGGQDIDFSFRLHKLGIKSTSLDGSKWRCGHLHITRQGDSRSNATGASSVAIV